MRPQDIKVGEMYRLYTSQNYGFVQPIEVIPPRTREITKTHSVVKCLHLVNRNDTNGFVRYFRPCDLIKSE